jgi:hypothetical protein
MAASTLLVYGARLYSATTLIYGLQLYGGVYAYCSLIPAILIKGLCVGHLIFVLAT